jgi:hypothetical protein
MAVIKKKFISIFQQINKFSANCFPFMAAWSEKAVGVQFPNMASC